MRYLFFDIECANCFNGQGKICSFGYCIVDEEFNIIHVEDILINPRSKFNLGPKNREPLIQLGYTKNKFNKSPDFKERYNKIHELLTYRNQIVFGHSVGNDLSFILSELKRYKRPEFYVKAFDTQALYKQISDCKNDIGLSTLCELYNINTENLHRSDCDAVMTMNVLKAICKERKKTVDELLAEFPNCYAELHDSKVIKKFEPIRKHKLLTELNKDLYEECHIKKKHSEIHLIAFDDLLEEGEYAKTRLYVEAINRAGEYAYTPRVKRANYYIQKDENSQKSQKAKKRITENKQGLTILTEQEFLSKFNISIELLEKNSKKEE